MNNLAITANISAVNQSSKSTSNVKTNAQSNISFIQSFMEHASAQTATVPGSQNEEAMCFWKNKLESEKELPGLEECLEEKIEDIIAQIEAFFSEQDDE